MVHDLEEDRGPLEHVDFSACFIDQFALRDHVPALAAPIGQATKTKSVFSIPDAAGLPLS